MKDSTIRLLYFVFAFALNFNATAQSAPTKLQLDEQGQKHLDMNGELSVTKILQQLALDENWKTNQGAPESRKVLAVILKELQKKGLCLDEPCLAQIEKMRR